MVPSPEHRHVATGALAILTQRLGAEAVPAMLAGRASAVSATTFAHFLTRAQIRMERQFTARLQDLLPA